MAGHGTGAAQTGVTTARAGGGYLAVPPRPGPGLRLFCFHHAGAGALSFARWQRRFRSDVSVVPVRLPGRETRRQEPRITVGDQLLDDLDRHLGPLLDDAPHAFYGHSLGALVAYSFAAHRARLGLRPPELTVTAACGAPHLPMPVPDGDGLSDTEFASVLGGPDGVAPHLLERPERLRSMVETLRDDLRLARSLRAAARTPLPGPLLALAGARDPLVPPEAVGAWELWTTAADFRTLLLDGDHFFVRDPAAALLVESALDRLRTAPPAPARHSSGAPSAAPTVSLTAHGGHPVN
jgi:surfactin synthase thioesterase subunit